MTRRMKCLLVSFSAGYSHLLLGSASLGEFFAVDVLFNLFFLLL